MTSKTDSTKNPEENEKTSWMKKLWTFLGSAKMAVFALAILSFFSAVGTLIPQNQEPAIYIGKYGAFWGKLFLLLRIDDLYYAQWFVFLLMLVALNLIISNMKRLSCLIHEGRELKIAMSVPFFTKSPKTVRLSASGLDQTRLEKSLKSLGYGTKKEEKSEGTYYFAEKGRMRRWGSFITHTGILIVFIGVIYGHLPGMGFKGMANLSLEPGQDVFEVRQSDFYIRLLDTGSKQDETGRPTDYYSHVEVLEKKGDKAEKVAEKTIRVNDPLEYKGVKFFQSDFGVVGFYLRVIDDKGNKYQLPIELSPDGSPVMTPPMQIGESGMFVFLHGFNPDYGELNGEVVRLSNNYNNPAAQVFLYENFSNQSTNKWKARGWVTKAKPLMYNGFKVTMGDLVKYTGLQFRKDPGVSIVWLGFILTTIGLFVSFYISDRNMRLLLLAGGDAPSLYIQTHSRLEESFDHEISVIQSNPKES